MSDAPRDTDRRMYLMANQLETLWRYQVVKGLPSMEEALETLLAATAEWVDGAEVALAAQIEAELREGRPRPPTVRDRLRAQREQTVVDNQRKYAERRAAGLPVPENPEGLLADNMPEPDRVAEGFEEARDPGLGNAGDALWGDGAE